jgi:hypothetical protein
MKLDYQNRKTYVKMCVPRTVINVFQQNHEVNDAIFFRESITDNLMNLKAHQRVHVKSSVFGNSLS